MPTLGTEELSAALPVGYTVLPYTQELLPAILSLLQQTLGNSGAVRKTEEFWQWKHHANPFGTSYGLCAWDEVTGQAASLRVLMRWTLCSKERLITYGARAVDTATHPDHQRRGLFSKLTRQAIAELTELGIDFIFNTPNQKSLPGYLKMGWHETARWPLYLKPLRPVRMAYRRLRPLSGEAAMCFANHFSSAILPWDGFVRTFGDQIAELLSTWECSRKQSGLRTLRTMEYLAWRYGSHPHIQYGIYPHTDQRGLLLGFAILRPNGRFGWQETVLTELCLAKPDVITGVHLLRSLTRHLHSDYLVAHFAHRTIEAEILHQSTFWKVPRQRIIFTVRPLQATASFLCQDDAWDLTLGDLELF